jgi:hypothetical protein
VDVTQFKVQTPALAAAAPVINSAAGHAGSAQRAATAAAGQEGAFGGEPIGAVFAAMCGRAHGATSELEQTGPTLARRAGRQHSLRRALTPHWFPRWPSSRSPNSEAGRWRLDDSADQ